MINNILFWSDERRILVLGWLYYRFLIRIDVELILSNALPHSALELAHTVS